MKIATTKTDDLIEIIATYTTQIKLVSMPSGAVTGSVQYGNLSKSIGDRRHSEEAVIHGLYKMIRDDMLRECFIVEKFGLVPAKR